MRVPYLVTVLRKRGLKFILTYFQESLWFDFRYGVKTSARVPKESQSSVRSSEEKDNGLLYVASFTSVTRKCVALAEQLLGKERFSRFQFIDLGCGKGKALLVYAKDNLHSAQYPSIGIEYDPNLADIADENIAKMGFDRERVLVATASAVDFETFISSDCLLVYLYNSFQGDTLRTVLANLQRYEHVLIYVDPAEKNILDEFGYRVHATNQGKYNADTWLIASRNVSDISSTSDRLNATSIRGAA